MSKHRFAFMGAMGAILLLGACSSVPHKVQDEITSPEWKGKTYKNLLVMGVYDDRTYRVSSETAFAEELKKRHVTAEPSYDVIPDLNALDSEDEIAELLSSRDNDAVLSVATIDPGYDFDYEDALETRGMVYLLGGRPGSFTEMGNFISWAGSGHYTLHVALWDVATQKPVWQVTTSSQSTGSEAEDLKTLVDFVVTAARKKGMI